MFNILFIRYFAPRLSMIHYSIRRLFIENLILTKKIVMKKNLIFLFALLCTVTFFFTSCKDDEKPEVPPTVEDVVAEYSADKLSVTVDGVAASEGAKVELVKSGDESLNIKLLNIVPGVKEVSIPNATFEATTRSMYVSKLTGTVKDNVSGYDVTFNGVVDEGVLTAQITLLEIKGDTVNTSALQNSVYKGNMEITVAGAAAPTIEQRVYTLKPNSYKMNKRDTAMIKLQIQNFDFQGLVLGDITLDTILVQKRGDVFAFKAADRKIKLDAIGEVTANLQGTIVGDNMNLNLDIDAASLKVGVGFNGSTVVENQVAKITKMTIEGDAVIEQKMSGTSSLTFKVWDDVDDAKLLLTPKYELSEKAKVDSIVLHVKGKPNVYLTKDQIEGKQPIDFSLLKNGKDDYIKYFLKAEDPNYQGSFIVYVERMPVTDFVFDMQSWDEGEPKGLATSNSAADFFPMFDINVPTPVVKGDDNAAIITTSRTVSTSNPNGLIPGVTAGTLFNGIFKISDISNPLTSTKFGNPYNKEPKEFKFTYKYTPGKTFYKTVTVDYVNDTEEVSGKTDECSITAYLYEVDNYDETLDGSNINNAESKVILKAALEDGTAKGDYTTKTISFKETGKGSYDSTKKYKLAIVCTSSKEGDKFMGADGSQLWVKYLEIISK